jgi:hypothetical protein
MSNEEVVPRAKFLQGSRDQMEHTLAVLKHKIVRSFLGPCLLRRLSQDDHSRRGSMRHQGEEA